ncbi:MAG: BamA/TamA family outer membrane protein [Gemmatimonadaceae bacterium]
MTPKRRVRLGATALAFLGTLAAAGTAGAQDISCDRGDLEVLRLEFEGNTAFPDAELAKTIVNTPSAWARRYLHLPFTVKHCLDRLELPNDRARLVIFYRRRGYPKVTVDTVVKQLAPGAVELRFKISEGPPIITRSFVVRGLEPVPERERIARNLPVREGARFDRFALDAAADSIRERLHNNGYPRADAANSFTVSDSLLLAWDTLTVTPGPRTRIGTISIEVKPLEGKDQQIPTRTVRRIMGLDSGRLFRESEILDAQRALYRTEAYQHVSITPDSASSPDDSLITLSATLAEAAMHAARVGVGYGTLDCFRASGEFIDYNFGRGARRLDINARVSKIGIGRPLNGVEDLCPAAKKDEFSNRLNYYLGATLRQPVFFGLRTVPTITVYSQRVSEYNAYIRTTAIGGVASLSWRGLSRTPVTLAYSLDLGRTEASPALFCAVFNLCEEAERRRIQETQRLAVLSASVTRDHSNSLLSPTRGSVIRFEARHSSPAILSNRNLQFNKVVGDAARYIGSGGGSVLAFRLRGGTVFGRTFGAATGFVPPQERLYAGGPTTVRGFAQNELGSAIYIANPAGFRAFPPVPPDTLGYLRDTTIDYRRVVPVGGNALIVANLELRLRSPFLPDLLQWTVFTDAGEVWNRGSLGSLKVKVTPGIQLTAFSPVGPIRAAVGYNPYSRPAGPIYYEATREGGQLVCVSPGNTLPATDTTTAEGRVITQASGVCPSTFKPAADKSFRRRLTFSFAIGQAF